MLRRVVIGVAMACLMGGAAYAVDEEAGDNKCTAQLTAVEEAVQNKIDANALSEAEAEKVNEMLDEADALCTEGKFTEASATLATISGWSPRRNRFGLRQGRRGADRATHLFGAGASSRFAWA